MGKRRKVENGDVGRSAERDAAGNGGRSIRASRLAFALALTALMVGTFVSFGGLSYAGTATTNAVNTITKLATGHKVVVHNSSASNQYAKPKKKTKHEFTASKGTSHGSTGTQGTLPFTGLSLAGTTLISGLLLLLGIILRRRERRSS